MGDFKKLKAWQKSQDLVEGIYRTTRSFPAAEKYGLSAQMRRAAVSVSANLAEGCGRMGDNEMRRFVRLSLGSLSELECELLLAGKLQLVDGDVSRDLLLSIGSLRGMLQRLHRTLPASAINPLDLRP
jgi:four helix bundle protein